MGARDRGPAMPVEPIHRLTRPLQRFLHIEAAGGVVLLGCTALALALANSPFRDAYLALWKTEVGFTLGEIGMHHSLEHWINDGLMAVFFFVMGLEVKRELVVGELRDPRRAALPVVAALGGMLVPAALYLLLVAGEPGEGGWGIAMATDIAFVVGCMALLGSRVPHGLRVTIVSLAIADDIGAIGVIAIGYTESLDLVALGLGALGIVAVHLLARLGVRRFSVYTFAGALVWLAFHESGIHATIGGVILGLMTPARSYVRPGLATEALAWLEEVFQGAGLEQAGHRAAAVRKVRKVARETVSPLEFLEEAIHPWVAFVVLPLFALANAGVAIDASAFTEPVAVAVAVGLVLGKPLGITLFSALAVRTGLARMPEDVSWRQLLGGGALAGIGFTMALFIAGLALEDELLTAAKVGILTASIVSAAVGISLLATGRGTAPEPARGP